MKTHPTMCLFFLAFGLAACGTGENREPGSTPETPEAPEIPEAPEAAEAPVVPAPRAEPAPPDEAAAIARAEAFARAQGYLDTPATVSGDAIVHEGIEGSMEDRRDSLEPRALRALRGPDGWSVVFAYRTPRTPGVGRMLRMPDGETPRFVHQDLLLDRVLGSSPSP